MQIKEVVQTNDINMLQFLTKFLEAAKFDYSSCITIYGKKYWYSRDMNTRFFLSSMATSELDNSFTIECRNGSHMFFVFKGKELSISSLNCLISFEDVSYKLDFSGLKDKKVLTIYNGHSGLDDDAIKINLGKLFNFNENSNNLNLNDHNATLLGEFWHDPSQFADSIEKKIVKKR